MKKIMLLGGSAQQIIAINKAKELGYYAILCDYLPDNPGQYVADKWYPISTTDRDRVMKVAIDEKVSGIVSYSSDPAAPTAAYVSEKLGLPGIPYRIAESFCNKHLFRKYLKENGFHVPKSIQLSVFSKEEDISPLEFPVIIKPTDSSGSKGVSVLNSISQFKKAKEYALREGRNDILIAEEYIVRDHPDVIEAEIFVAEGEVKIWGLMNTIRDESTNPLLPAAYSYPLNISEDRIELVKREVSRLVKSTGVKYGAFNIEMIITKDEKLFFLDAGPRNGGNELPEFIGTIAKTDIVKSTVLSAMGEYNSIENIGLNGIENGFWGMMVLHSRHAGIYKDVEYDDIARKFLFRESYFINKGDYVGAFDISRDAIGLAFFEFTDKKVRDEILNDFDGRHIKIKLSDCLV